jgi:outer membrane protein TolC
MIPTHGSGHYLMTARRHLLLVSVLWLVLVSAVAEAQPAAPAVERLTLDDAIARGLDASHRLEEVRERGDAARAVAAQRHAATLPRLSGQAGYTRTNHVEVFGVLLPNNQLRVIYPDIPDNYRTRADFQWGLYTGGRLPALERAAQGEATALSSDAAAMRDDLKLDIARAYWTLVSVTESVRVLDESLTQVAAHLRDARNRLDAGLIPPNEVLSVEAQQSRQRMLRIQAAASRDMAEAALARLAGFAPGTRLEPNTPLDLPPPVSDRLDALLETAQQNRSDRRALAERVGAAAQRIDAAAAGKRPTIAVGGGVDYARPNARIFPRQGSWQESWDASINLDWPIFDGGRTRADVAEATASRRAAAARLAEFDSVLALELQQRLSELESSRAAIDAADDAIRAATEAHRVVGERFAAGVATSTDVLDAQMAILQSGLDRTQALASLRTADAGLLRATGR